MQRFCYVTMLHYYLFHKPYQVLSQFSAEGDKLTLQAYCKVAKDVYPVGRLDYDSEGLLILTNDTTLNYKLLHPTQQHERTYWVQVDGAITDAAIAALCDGVVIQVNGKAYRTQKAIVQRLADATHIPPRNPPIRFRKDIPTSWIAITLTEGKNRQVRKMTAAVGFPTLRLIRYSIELLTLDGLEPGAIKMISQKTLFKKLGL
ncbi:MAG: pseudouridine synthase [Chitinophagaceae bacterium]